MKVVLRKNIDNLGKGGDVVSVKDGFARNYLLPKGLAMLANEDNIKRVEQEKKRIAKDKEIERNKAQQVAEKLQGISCTIAVEAQEDNLYGSITAAEISKALEVEQIKVDKKDIILEQPIRKLGIYEVEIKLHPEIKSKIKVWVVAK